MRQRSRTSQRSRTTTKGGTQSENQRVRVITTPKTAPKVTNKVDKNTLKVIPLGGLHEIGKNTCVFEINDEIILVDAGLAFPSDEMHGVNIVLPDVTYLRENRHKIKGMIVTHGHEDHIGGIAFHLKQFDIPVIYGPRLAMALLADKLEEAGVSERTELRTVQPRDTVQLGQSFSVEYIRNTHSMADSFTVAITTPAGTVIFTGDFKVDHTPVDGEYFDFARLAAYGEKGVLCLISDSTNAEVPGHTPSERSVFPNLDRAFSEAPGRLMVTTFASSVHRVNMLLELAQKHNRSVFVVGRSMLNVIAHARNLGYIKCPDDVFKPLNTLNSCPDEKAMILTTGSQGEPMAALTRISNGSHRQIKVRAGDTIIFSANPIPGNTIAVVNTIDRLMAQGANVIYGKRRGLHVSGHGAQEDQKLMLALTRPKYFLPVHGEHRMLVKHAATAQSMGIPAENMVVIQNGDIVAVDNEQGIRIAGKVSSGIELVDSSRNGIVGRTVLKERQQLAEDGIITVSATVDGSGRLLAPPAVHLRGVVTKHSQGDWEEKINRVVTSGLRNRWSEVIDTSGDQKTVRWDGLRSRLEEEVRHCVRRELPKRYPIIVLLMQPVEAKAALGAAESTKKRVVAV
ncbi:ribonuclease J [Leptolyngbya cf. ectocarpi LEGE 11479]|uniref:Ribonuclease J n=1 Tax=Leptolyngbya cf. ectocarpi LEGE 11479 TaxID=1828722 RepID=A0A928X439_LEPEC|nr:ribonuclease J [Leptolyngbya ectocarpi]MBE9066188.1 ribonuclease J [Leptolyngbya cf. ectocarpi LEGE 11479]